MINQHIQKLIDIFRQMPGIGYRSARRIALHITAKDPQLGKNIIHTLQDTIDKIKHCSICHNIDVVDPCYICSDKKRNQFIICVVEQVLDLWSMEKFCIHDGLYHVLGGVLSVANDVEPADLNIKSLCTRLDSGASQISEIILALNATTESNITMFYLTNILKKYNIKVSTLGRGMPMGGELDYLDEGTVAEAFKSRRLIP